jgi:hypothetical protein
VTDHLVVAALLLGGHGELVPDVHPVAVVAIDALTADLYLNLCYKLLTDEINQRANTPSELEVVAMSWLISGG